MRTTTQILPGVRAVGWVDCLRLPKRVDLHGICGSQVAVLTDIHTVEFFDEPDCRCVTEKDGGGYTDTATLKFHAAELLPIHRKLGFVVTDVNGRSYLIGSQEPPFPTVKAEMLCGAPDGDGAGFQYEIKHVAIKSMVPCVI